MGRKKIIKYAIDTILEKIGRKKVRPVAGLKQRPTGTKSKAATKQKRKENLDTGKILKAGKGEFLQAKHGNVPLNLLKNQPRDVIQAARDRRAGLPISKEHQEILRSLGAGTSSTVSKATKKAVKKKSKTKKLNSEE